MRKSAWSLVSDRGGAIAPIFAIILTAIVVAFGVAIDYDRAVTLKAKLQGAADAAALAGASSASQGEAEATKAAEAIAASNLSNKKDVPQGYKTAVNLTNGSMSVTVSADLPTTFMRLTGKKQVPVTATATASSAGYQRITFLVDGSFSMGIGATIFDQNTMVQATNCAYACHYPDSWTPDTFNAIRKTNAVLRIDVVKQGLTELVTRLRKDFPTGQQMELSMYYFGNELQRVFGPTTDYETALQAISQVDLPKSVRYLGTNLHKTMAQLAASLPESGAGSSPSDRKSSIVVITDAIENDTTATLDSAGVLKNWRTTNDFLYNSPTAYDLQSPVSDACGPLRSKSHDIYVQLLEYLVPTSGSMSTRNVAKFDFIKSTLNAESEQRLRACAGDGRFVKASSPTEIVDSLASISNTIAKEHFPHLIR